MNLTNGLRLLAMSVAATLVLTPSRMKADDLIRPVTSSYMLVAGSAHRADTYLSPLKYSGWHTAFRYERLQAMRFDPENWIMRLDLGLNVSNSQNPRRNSSMTAASVKASWGMTKRWMLPYGLSAGVGGSTSLDLGGIYNSRNSNNPVAADVSWTVDLSGFAAWNGNIGRLPVTMRWQTTLPLAGVFFAPDYGELYYEIWLGNHSGLVHPAWWGDWFRWSNLLTADLHFGSTSLRVGYSGEITTWRVNDITSRAFLHGAVIGITTEWISLRPRSVLTREARIISATY